MKNYIDKKRQKPNANIAVIAYHIPRSSNFFRKQLAIVSIYVLAISLIVFPLLPVKTNAAPAIDHINGLYITLPETGSEKNNYLTALISLFTRIF
jgi:hypothetical protein